MTPCAFCEENIVEKAIHRGDHAFCSQECAESYFLTYGDSGSLGDHEFENPDDFEDYGDGDGDANYAGGARYSMSFEDDDDS